MLSHTSEGSRRTAWEDTTQPSISQHWGFMSNPGERAAPTLWSLINHFTTWPGALPAPRKGNKSVLKDDLMSRSSTHIAVLPQRMLSQVLMPSAFIVCLNSFAEIQLTCCIQLITIICRLKNMQNKKLHLTEHVQAVSLVSLETM
jgi:hypothetical protein